MIKLFIYSLIFGILCSYTICIQTSTLTSNTDQAYEAVNSQNSICKVTSKNRWAFLAVKVINTTKEGAAFEIVSKSAKPGSDIYVISVDAKLSYAIFVAANVNSSGFCLTKSFKEFNDTNLELYTACKSNEIGYYSDFIYEKSEIYLKCVSRNTQPPNSSYCLNGGSVSQTYNGPGLRCKCTIGQQGIQYGPRCEVTQISLGPTANFSDFLYLPYILGVETEIRISFEIRSSGFTKVYTIFKIKDKSNSFLEYKIDESSHIFSALGKEVTVISKVDDDKWVFCKIRISKSTFSIVVNNNSKTDDVKFVEGTDFQTYMLEFYKIKNMLCMRNLYINSRLIDFYQGNNESCCADRCSKCTSLQNCICVPFKSETNTKCACKYGYKEDDTSKTCTKLPDNTKQQLPMKKEINKVFSQNQTIPFRITLKIRTRTINGTIFCVNELKIQICAKIDSSRLMLQINDNKSSIRRYNVSDGKWNIVTMTIRHYLVKLEFNEDLFDNSVELDTEKLTLISSVKFGQFQSSNNNHTACFSSISYGQSRYTQTNYFRFNNSIATDGCKEILPCPTCNKTYECKQEWQYSYCRCPNDTYEDKAKKQCILLICKDNKCQNGGVCGAHPTSSTRYYCTCPDEYVGIHCQHSMKIGILWWVAVLVVLLLLLIIIICVIIYYCYCIKEGKSEKKMDINSMNEYTVKYNEQAGEEDYKGPPIDFSLINKAVKSMNYPNGKAPTTQKTNVYPPSATPAELKRLKDLHDSNNPDLILDHPLEYGYEGQLLGEVDSLSSLGSGSTNSQLDITPLTNIRKISRK